MECWLTPFTQTPYELDTAGLSLPFVPKCVIDVELSETLPDITSLTLHNGTPVRHALCLVWLHAQPLGLVTLHLMENGLSAHECACQIWAALWKEIINHHYGDGLSVPPSLDGHGLPMMQEPLCQMMHVTFLQHAPHVSVIVPTRDRTEMLAHGLDALLSQDYSGTYDIFIIDNAPTTDATAHLVCETYRAYNQLHYVREDRPGGSRARNCGLKYATGEIVAFTDDDAIVDKRWLSSLVAAFEIADNVGCVTGAVLPIELETVYQEWFDCYSDLGDRFTRHIVDRYHRRPAHPLFPFLSGALISGNNMAYRRSALQAVGGFDPALGPGSPTHGGEDLAAYFALVCRGYQVVYEPKALIRHAHRCDLPGLTRQVYGYGVSLTAYLTKCIIDNPRLVLSLGRRIPYGLFYAFSSRSPRNAKNQRAFTESLRRAELKGMLYGPLAYVASRYRTHMKPNPTREKTPSIPILGAKKHS